MPDLYALMAREVTNLVEENERMHGYLHTTIERIDANKLIRHKMAKPSPSILIIWSLPWDELLARI